jgi:hypothetical protein
MGFLDRLFGAPTMDKVTRDMTRELQALGAEDVQAHLDRGELRFRLHGGPRSLFLANLLHDLQRAPRAGRAAVMQRFLAGVSAADALPQRYDEARASLMPVVRARADVGLAALAVASSVEAAAGADAGEAQDRQAFRPLAGELVVALVFDTPSSMAYVNEQTLERWQVDFDTALAEALHNLRGLPEHGGWKSLGDGVWSGEWGDSYDSSRLLLPDLIHRTGVRDPVVVAPFRNALMVTAGDNAAGIARMAQAIEDALEDNPRWLSFELLRLDGTRLAPHSPLVAADAWHRLRLRNAASADEQQKRLLDALHERRKIDLWVASSQMVARDDLGTLGFSVWSNGVDTLLPHTEFLLFNPDNEDAGARLLLPWADAVEIVGDLMEPTGYVPERVRVRRFPDAAQLARLKERSLTL